MPVTSISKIKFDTKWTRARRMWNSAMKDRNNDAMACVEYFTSQALRHAQVAKRDPNGNGYKFGILSERCRNAATYGINLAFGIDKAKA